jgi:hypothetical protein
MPYGSKSRKEYDAQRSRYDDGPEARKKQALAEQKERKLKKKGKYKDRSTKFLEGKGIN